MRKLNKRLYKRYLKIAKENGIPARTYYDRMQYRGWNYEDAATLPPGSRKPKYEEE